MMIYGMFLAPEILLIIIISMVISLYAQYLVRSAFNKFSKVPNMTSKSGYDAARIILDAAGLPEVDIEMQGGKLTDFYDPRKKILSLSREVYSGKTISSIGVAAHEAGHAIQHSQNYLPLKVRHAMLPALSFGSQLAMPMIVFGIIIQVTGLIDIGIILFSLVVLFHFVTLPVEFNASSRAVNLLTTYGIVTPQEVPGVKKVLRAAAMTYVAATIVALLQLLQLLLIRNSRD